MSEKIGWCKQHTHYVDNCIFCEVEDLTRRLKAAENSLLHPSNFRLQQQRIALLEEKLEAAEQKLKGQGSMIRMPTLRDLLAGSAMQGFLANSNNVRLSRRDITQLSYEYADDMLLVGGHRDTD
jgi:hypothetical protein